MKVLVIAEHDCSVVKASTLSAITAARKIGGEVHVLVAGHQAQKAAQDSAKFDGVGKVLHADAVCYQDQQPENLALLVVQLAEGYSHVIAAATAYGKNLLPRVAALLDVQPLSDVTDIVDAQTFVRPMYAGNVMATVRIKDSVKAFTVRTTAFEAAGAKDGTAQVETIGQQYESGLASLVEVRLTQSDRPELSSAKVVVSGGRGVGSKENFEHLIEPLAGKLGAAVGASRAAVDAGYASNDLQVGQTGKIVAPRLYVAVGVSGAIQHLAGMKDSQMIIAINKDPDAPIFDVADYGLVGDLFEVLPQLTSQL